MSGPREAPRYRIGIDLGTTNSVLAYVDAADPGRGARVMALPQWEGPVATVEGETLPSFYYLATAAERQAGFVADGAAPGPAGGWVPGVFARGQMALSPGRVIHSAKSWLCHGGVDRTAPILPWQSEDVPLADRLSPVQASAGYLAYFREVWDRTVARGEAGAAFALQDVVITVPASFDEAAQQLTVDAARLAGYPEGLRLVEEPQAAFYDWLGRGRHLGALAGVLERSAGRTARVLVCDVGGGTTDLSLFEVTADPANPIGLALRRVAVSDHLLLGGDNIDLALAHLLEQRLTGGEAKITGRPWGRLLAQARELKERVLGDEAGDPAEEFPVTVAGSGAGLFAATRTTRIAAGEVRAAVLDGFFPECEAGDRPHRRAAGLREWGLPFAADPAVTRHLAAFLDGHPVDAVLFNGGTLTPAFLRRRLVAMLARWQDGREPVELPHRNLALAVGQGAAHYAHLLHEPDAGPRIASGHAHALYLEVFRRKGKSRSLVCILPRGMEAGQSVAVADAEFDLLVNQPVRFQCFYSNRRDRSDPPGAVVAWDEDAFQPLPPLQTAIHLAPDRPKPANNRIRVTLEGALNEVGLLQVYCVEAAGDGRWRLDFNLRRGSADDEEGQPEGDAPLVPRERLDAAHALIRSLYGKKKDPDLPEVQPRQLMKRLEAALGQERSAWDGATLRALWPPLADGMTRRNRSVDHEEAWLYLAGFALRPGYGVELDPSRIEELWRLASLGIGFPKEKRVRAQWHLLWRRTAGGLNAARQARVAEKVLPALRSGSDVTAEMIHLVGSLERLPLDVKAEMAERMAATLRKRRPGHKAPQAWALGRLLTRTPLYAGPDAILPPRLVEDLFEKVRDLDWTDPAHQDLVTVFAQIARRTDRRGVDVDPAARREILAKMERSGARPEQLRVVREAVPVDDADRVRQFGESLPTGLVLV